MARQAAQAANQILGSSSTQDMSWWRRKQRENDLERELRSHLDLEAEEQRAAGLSPLDARRVSLRTFGNATLVKEEVRETWGWMFVDRLKQDIAYALRGMRKSPGFTATAVLSLALGIGANSAIFSLIDAVLLRWLPVHDPQSLVQLIIRRQAPDPLESFAYPLVQALNARSDVFSGVAGFSGNRFFVGQGHAVESTPGAWVTGAFYETLAVQPVAGRLLRPSDDQLRAPSWSQIITDSYYRAATGNSATNPQAIGATLTVEGKPVTIVGVSPPGFTGANVGEIADLTIPLGVLPQLQPDRPYQLDGSAWWLRVLACSQPGISREQAKARMAVIWPPLWQSVIRADMPGAVRRLRNTTLDLLPGGTGYTDLRRRFRQPLLVLLAVSGLLLLIACANVANLLLARASTRSREIAVRLAIGAGRARVVRQLLTESLLLSTFGAALGVLLAWSGSRLLVDLLSSGQIHAIALDVTPDGRVLAFTTAAAVLTAILFGLAPAFRGTAAGPGRALKQKPGRVPLRCWPPC